jgi:hypothetical protein
LILWLQQWKPQHSATTDSAFHLISLPWPHAPHLWLYLFEFFQKSNSSRVTIWSKSIKGAGIYKCQHSTHHFLHQLPNPQIPMFQKGQKRNLSKDFKSCGASMKVCVWLIACLWTFIAPNTVKSLKSMGTSITGK